MRRLLFILLSVLLVFSLTACGKGNEEITAEIPPGLTVLQKQLKMTKHTQKGENTAFSQSDFEKFLGGDMTYITVNTLPENGTLVCNGAAVLKGQTIPVSQLEYLKFVPNSGCVASFFDFSCDSLGYHGNQIRCEMVFTSETNLSPVVTDGNIKTVEGISCYGELDITEPNGDKYTVNVITYPSHGYISVGSDGKFVYTPEEGFSGNDKLVYSVTDYFGEKSASATLKINVENNQTNLVFADMEEDTSHLAAHRMCRDNIMVYRIEDGKYYFDPQTSVSRMDFLVMLMCVTGLDKDITAVADSVINDDDGLSSGIKGYISAANDKGIIQLENGNFQPKNNITFSDAAYMITKALKLPVNASASENGGDGSVTAMVNAGIAEAGDIARVITKSEAAALLCAIEDYILENNIQNNG